MGDEETRESLGLEEPLSLLVEVLAGDLVNRAEGLIEQEHWRLQSESPRERGAHLHSTRERFRIVVGEAREADGVDGLEGETPSLIAIKSMQLREKLNVAEHGAPRKQRCVLKDIAEPVTVDLDFTRGRLEKTGRNFEQGRLSATGGPDDGDELSLGDRERGFAHGLRAIGEDHPDVPEGEGLSGGAGVVVGFDLGHRVTPREARSTSKNLVVRMGRGGTTSVFEPPRITALTKSQEAQEGRQVSLSRSGMT